MLVSRVCSTVSFCLLPFGAVLDDAAVVAAAAAASDASSSPVRSSSAFLFLERGSAGLAGVAMGGVRGRKWRVLISR